MPAIARRLISRAREEKGFTLTELLVVVIIIGVLLAIAVPAYISFRDRAESTAGEANLRAALPAVETYYTDNGSDYTGMNLAALQAIDASIQDVRIITVAAATYCIEAGPDGTPEESFKDGPDTPIAAGSCN